MSTNPGLTPWAIADTSLGPPDPVPELPDPEEPEEPDPSDPEEPEEPEPNGDCPELPDVACVADVLEVGCQATWPMATPATRTRTANSVASTATRER
jgi:hypothetical protein